MNIWHWCILSRADLLAARLYRLPKRTDITCFDWENPAAYSYKRLKVVIPSPSDITPRALSLGLNPRMQGLLNLAGIRQPVTPFVFRGATLKDALFSTILKEENKD